MTLVTEEAVAAAAAEVEKLRSGFPTLPKPGSGPLEAWDAAIAANQLAKLAGSPSGHDLRLAEKRRRDLATLRARQLAAIEAHAAAEAALGDRLAEMTAELASSRERLVRACSGGTLIDVGTAGREQDGLVRRLAAELRSARLLLEEHDHQHEQGAIEDGAHTGLRLNGRWWLTIDPFLLVKWRANAEVAALFGPDHSDVIQTRDRYRTRLLDLRLDGLLDGVKLPKPGRSQLPMAPRRLNVTDQLIAGDPLAGIDKAEQAALANAPIGHRDYIRSQARQQRQRVAAELTEARGK